MKRILINIFLIVASYGFCSQLNAQIFNWGALNQQSNRLPGKLSGTIYHLPAEESKLHFYHAGWPEGSILLEDGDLYEDLHMQYLAFGDELVVYNSNLKQLFIVDKEKVAGFTVHLPQGKQEFIKMYFNGLRAGDRYFEKIYDGKCKLLVFHSVDKVRTSIYKDNAGRLRDTNLKQYTTYYFYSPATGFKRLQPRRSSVLNLFPEKKEEARKILRENNLYRLTEKEMVKVFNLLEKEGFFL
jgi:hypothetical protein